MTPTSAEIRAAREAAHRTKERKMRELKWIDCDDLAVDQKGFLVCIEPFQAAERYELRDRPPLTNQSREPRVVGWCGTGNAGAVYACGLWEVVKLARNGRAKICQLVERQEIAAALEELGFPELIDDALTAHG